MLPWRATIVAIGLVAAYAAAGAGTRAGAMEFRPGGDGSEAKNPDLLRPSYDCDAQCAARGVPDEGYQKFFDIEWRLGLKGSYVTDTDGDRFEAVALPSVTLTHEWSRARGSLSAGAEIVKASDAEARLGSISAAGTLEYQLDRVTALKFGANVARTQDDAHVPGQPSTLLNAPEVLSGAIDAEATRRFGRFDAALRGRVARVDYGDTLNVDLTATDNSSLNYTALSTGLRLGFEVTPVISVFADGSAERDLFDYPSPSLLVKTDADTYTLRGGVSGKWSTIFSAEASIGIGYRDFEDATLSNVRALLYDASATWRPNDTTSVTGSFATTLAPPGPNAGGTTRVQYEAALNLEHIANRWLKLRAGLDWRQASFEGSAETESAYGVAAGADYLVNSYATVSADYRFSHVELTPNPAYESHRFTLGVNLKR